jgi:metallo-beta-lactamase class B
VSIALLTTLLALSAPADAGGGPTPAAPPTSVFGRDSTLSDFGRETLAPGTPAAGTPAPGTPVRGNLDKEIIRRIIRSHIQQVKDCYEQELTTKPTLGGRIMVQFTIAASGQVIASVLLSSTMGNGRVETCTVQAVRHWQFPKPRGGIVIVSYPFVLTPSTPIPIPPVAKGGGTVYVTFLDDKTVVHRSMNAQGVPSNGLIVVTDDGLLLVDTAWTEPDTEAVLAWGEKRFARPWVGAVITHDHGDRDGGLGALQRRHIPVAALDLTVAKLEKRGVHGVTTLFTASAATVTDPRGFEAYYPGPGHASDNIVLKFPNALYGGCLIKSMEAKDLGFTGDANLALWPEAVGRVLARYPHVTIVPGHGSVDRTGGALQHTLDLLAAVQRK